MIIHDVIQGTDKWVALRLGIPTASGFPKIITPSKGDLSKQNVSYMAEKLAERFLGQQLEDAERRSSFMERGNALEDEAVCWYEMRHKCDVTRVGFITDDAREVGCSPDGLVGDDGVLEIKCPNAKNHVLAMIQGTIGAKYNCQIQGNLWLTGRQWCDTISYNPAMPSLVCRVERDDEFIAKMMRAMSAFLAQLEAESMRFDVPSDWRDRIIVQPPDVDDNYLCEINPEDKPGWDMAVAAHARKTQEQAQVAFEAGAQVQ